MSGQPSTAAGAGSSDRPRRTRYFPTAIPKIAKVPVLTL
jgi:hypothetical protein